MAFSIITETYNSLAALYANAGSWVTGQIKVRSEFLVLSSVSLPITVNGDVVSLPAGYDFGDYGFVTGDTISLTFTSYSLALGGTGTQTFSRTVTYVNGNLMYISSVLSGSFSNNKTYPTSGQVSAMTISANKVPQQIDFFFNLVESGTTGDESVIDTEVNRWMADVTSLAVSGSSNMTQLGDKSGGLMKDVTISRTADTGTAGIQKNYTINFKFLQWGLVQDANEVPTWYDQAQCLAPYITVKSYSLLGNPNGVMFGHNGAVDANVGFLGENYNGGVNAYTLTSMNLTDANADIIAQIDYSGDTDFEATITTPGQLNATSTYRIGMFFSPVTDSLYKNNIYTLGQNLLLNAPDQNFLHSASPDVTVYAGYENADGVRFDLTNLQFSHAAGTLTVTGTIQPTAAAQDYFDALPDGERKLIMFVRIGDYLKTGTSSTEVNLPIYSDDCYDAPTLGVQHPYVLDKFLYDHGGVDVTDNTTPNTTTEDDMLYVQTFQLVEEEEYEGVRVAITAKNDTLDESFVLEEQFLSFANVPYVTGKHEANISLNRGFLLPPTTDRNVISLVRDSSLDVGALYGFELNYGFMNRWQYWLEQLNANTAFFDMTEDNNGLNKDWQHYQSTGWYLSIDTFYRKNGVDDFDYQSYDVRTYEDDPDVSCAVTITAPDGANPTTWLNNTIHEVSAVFSWNNTFTNEWSEITVEDHEGNRVGFISSVLDQGNVLTNPLKPISGETKLKLTNGGNTLTAEFLMDTNVISSNLIDLTYRVYSEPREELGYLIPFGKEASLAYSFDKLSPTSLYSGPCCRVRRSTDDVQMDIPFLNNALDEATLLTFIGAASAYIVTMYDQSGFSNNATQTDTTKQPRIALDGVVDVSPASGKPCAIFDGTNDYWILTNAAVSTQHVLQTWVFVKSTNDNISLGNLATTPQTTYWKKVATGNIVTELNAAQIDHGVHIGTGDKLVTLHHDGSNNSHIYIDGTLVSSEADALSTKSFAHLGVSDGVYSVAKFQELVLWNTDKSTQLTAINDNTISRYGL